MTSFVGFLITAADDATVEQGLTPDQIIKLHEDLVRTIGDIMEYLRDRWDEFLASTRGIESAQTSERSIFEDPITPAAVRLIAIWLRDDDGEALRTAAAGLVDLFAELYKINRTSSDTSEIRLPIIAALEGILQTSDGREAFNNSDLLSHCLYPDLRAILLSQDADLTTGDYLRGSAIVQNSHILMEHDENQNSHPGATDLIESIAKLDVKPVKATASILDRSRLDFQTDVLELAVTLLNLSTVDVPSATQQRIKAVLNSATSKVTKNWRVLNDESMITRVSELHLD